MLFPYSDPEPLAIGIDVRSSAINEGQAMALFMFCSATNIKI